MFSTGCKKGSNESIINSTKEDEQYGKIYCESYPPGAKIYIDSTFTGKFTPSVIDSVTEDIHVVSLQKNYFLPFDAAIQVKINTIPAIRCTLKQAINISNWFPLTVGSSWVFQRSDTGILKVIDTVSFVVSDIDSASSQTVGSLWTEKYRTYTDSLIACATSDTINFYWTFNLSVPRRTFIYPLNIGSTWKVGYYDYTVDTVETVIAKAGVFVNCYKVKQVSSIPNTYGWTWYWVHPQNGIVNIYDFDGQQQIYHHWNLMSVNIAK